MAARAPSSPTAYIDQATLYPRQQILTTEPSNITNDQQLCLTVERMIFCDVFWPIDTTNAAFSVKYHEWAAREKRCGATHHAASSVYTSVYAWASDASNFTIRVSTSTANADIAVTASHTSKIWRAFDTTQIWAQAANGNQVSLYMKRDSGAGTIYCAGICCFYA